MWAVYYEKNAGDGSGLSIIGACLISFGIIRISFFLQPLTHHIGQVVFGRIYDYQLNWFKFYSLWVQKEVKAEKIKLHITSQKHKHYKRSSESEMELIGLADERAKMLSDKAGSF